jgi:uncharacterized protein (DUF2236 family)
MTVAPPAPAPTLRDVVAGFPRAPAEAVRPSTLFPPGSIARRLTAERILVLGGGRALLMQLAHPMVAAGVADHRDPARLPWDRLWGTLDVVLTVVFGSSEQVAEVSERIGTIHRGVVGERDGRAYRALDTDLLRWVHATLEDSAVATWSRFVGPLPRSVRARYHEEMKAFATVFGLPAEEVPATPDELDRYVASTIEGLEISPEARRLAREVLHPPVPTALCPAVAAHRLATVGSLPARLRQGFELAWSPGSERALRIVASAVRAGRPLLPPTLTRWPHAAEAEGRERLSRGSR